MNDDVLLSVIGDELRRQPSPAVVEFAARLAARAAGTAVAVLFYGSALRTGAVDGVLDYYVLLDDVRAWPAPWLAGFANRLLPPNVSYVEERIGDSTLRAKVAVMSLAQFQRGMSSGSVDTTLWARFESQPCACVFARPPDGAAAVAAALRQATVTAAQWAAWATTALWTTWSMPVSAPCNRQASTSVRIEPWLDAPDSLQIFNAPPRN